MNLKYSSIVGTGSYLPAKVLTNFDLEKMVETSNDWILERTGIKERRIAHGDEATSDMAVKASQDALKMAGFFPESIDLIICATTTPDHPLPATACIIQKMLGAKKAACFDLQAACSGFLYALSVAESFIKSRQYKRILIIGADKLSTITNYKDRESCVLFGDAAGAVVVVPSDEPGVYSTHLGSFGEQWELLKVPFGGSRFPLRKNNINEDMQYVKMTGREVFKNAVTALTDYALIALETNDVRIKEVNHIVPHQANYRIIEAFARRAEIPIERFIVNVDRLGNTSSATIPVVFDEATRNGKFKKNEIVLTAAFGAGLTVASSLIKWKI